MFGAHVWFPKKKNYLVDPVLSLLFQMYDDDFKHQKQYLLKKKDFQKSTIMAKKILIISLWFTIEIKVHNCSIYSLKRNK